MSKIKHSGPGFTNENTVRRRAWIAKALEGARSRSDCGEDDILAAEEAVKPRLYVVKTDKVR